MNEENKNNYEQWYELASTITVDSLGAFAKTVKGGVVDSNSLIHAIISTVCATTHAFTYELGVNPEFMRLLSILVYRQLNNMEDGFTNILNYDDMLDPVNRRKFDKVMQQEVFEDLQQKAMAILESGQELHPATKHHLESILAGRVPFGYEIIEDVVASNPLSYMINQESENCDHEHCEHCENDENLPKTEDVEYTATSGVYEEQDDFEELKEDLDDVEDDYEDEDYEDYDEDGYEDYSDPVFKEPEEEEEWEDEYKEEDHIHQGLTYAQASALYSSILRDLED